MKKFTKWILAFRPVSTIFSGLLVYDSFILMGKTVDPLLITLVCMLTSTTMLQNDYCDRHNDRKKGKDLAYYNPKIFIALLTILWALSIMGTAYYFYYREEILYGSILTICLIIGFFYSFSRTVKYLPALLVATFWSSLTLFCFNPANIDSLILVILFASIFSLNIASEILQDVKDNETDVDYKTTIITEGSFTKKQSVLISAGFILFSLICWFPIMREIRDMNGAHMLIPGLTFAFGFVGCCVTIIDILSYKEEYIKRKQRILDIGLGLMLIGIMLIPYCK